jgi:hypothetical protein
MLFAICLTKLKRKAGGSMIEVGVAKMTRRAKTAKLFSFFVILAFFAVACSPSPGSEGNRASRHQSTKRGLAP